MKVQNGTATGATRSFSVSKDMDFPCIGEKTKSPTTGNKHNRYAIALLTLTQLSCKVFSINHVS